MRNMQAAQQRETDAATEDPDAPGRYAIRLKGHLDDRWAAWFGGLTLTREDNGDTLLTGPVLIRPRCMDCSAKCVISACH